MFYYCFIQFFYKLAKHESHPDVTMAESWIKEIGNWNYCVSHKMATQHTSKLCETTEQSTDWRSTEMKKFALQKTMGTVISA